MTSETLLQLAGIISPIIMAGIGVFAKYKFGVMSAQLTAMSTRVTAVENENVKLRKENVGLREKIDELYERLVGGNEKKGKKSI